MQTANTLQKYSGIAVRAPLAGRTQYRIHSSYATPPVDGLTGPAAQGQRTYRQNAALLAERTPSSDENFGMPTVNSISEDLQSGWRQLVNLVKNAILLGGVLCAAVS